MYINIKNTTTEVEITSIYWKDENLLLRIQHPSYFYFVVLLWTLDVLVDNPFVNKRIL